MNTLIQRAVIAAFFIVAFTSCTHKIDTGFPVPDLYLYDNSSTVFTWTAHKYSNRTAVSGTIPGITVLNTSPNKMAAGTLSNSSFSILSESLLSRNNTRDSNVFNRFLSKLEFPSDISGHVLSVSGNNDTGIITVLLNFNRMSDTVQMSYGLRENVLSARANIDLLKFSVERAFDSLDKTCHVFHTGTDGISKVWSDVDICVKTVFTAN